MVEDAIAITVQLIKKLFIIGLEIFLGGFDTETNPQARFVPDIHEAIIDVLVGETVDNLVPPRVIGFGIFKGNKVVR